MSFSKIAISFENFEEAVEQKALEMNCKPFSDTEMTKEKCAARIKKAKEDFWYFDKTYFTSDMYEDGYSKPADFHRELVKIANTPGVQIILGARKHGKTAEIKKYFTWEILTGRLCLGGVLSSNLTNAWNILADIAALIKTPRIAFDFKPEFTELNKNQFILRLPNESKPRKIQTFSEDRSVRGTTHLFNRPKKILIDDLETRESSLSESSVLSRIKGISEAYQSLGADGVVIALGNNFDEKCAMNRLLVEQNDGILTKDWHVHVFRAWQDGEPLWKERFPAKTEAELRAMLKPYDEAEWQADFQQNPIPPDGFIFARLSPIPTYRVLPSDVKGVRWCDPNLAKKSKGDFTAMASLYYSSCANKFYLSDIVCRSFSDSNKLLDAYYNVNLDKVVALGFDGNVAQESSWTNNVKNYAIINNRPAKRIEYKRYNVDDLAKNVQGVWNEGNVLFPDNINETQDGRAFLAQIIAFAGKKAGKPDDAPDVLISSYEFICERRIYSRKVRIATSSVADCWNF